MQLLKGIHLFYCWVVLFCTWIYCLKNYNVWLQHKAECHGMNPNNHVLYQSKTQHRHIMKNFQAHYMGRGTHSDWLVTGHYWLATLVTCGLCLGVFSMPWGIFKRSQSQRSSNIKKTISKSRSIKSKVVSKLFHLLINRIVA